MSPSDTSEKALEESIEAFLAGAVVATTDQAGDAKEEGSFRTRGKGGYEKGDPKDFISAFALNEAVFGSWMRRISTCCTGCRTAP